jgi:hypothetical protein
MDFKIKLCNEIIQLTCALAYNLLIATSFIITKNSKFVMYLVL